jgi:hypothetical protein
VSEKHIRVKPRAGIILAGIPAAGADVPTKLAREWLDNGLVTEITEDEPKKKPASPAKET